MGRARGNATAITAGRFNVVMGAGRGGGRAYVYEDAPSLLSEGAGGLLNMLLQRPADEFQDGWEQLAHSLQEQPHEVRQAIEVRVAQDPQQIENAARLRAARIMFELRHGPSFSHIPTQTQMVAGMLDALKALPPMDYAFLEEKGIFQNGKEKLRPWLQTTIERAFSGADAMATAEQSLAANAAIRFRQGEAALSTNPRTWDDEDERLLQITDETMDEAALMFRDQAAEYLGQEMRGLIYEQRRSRVLTALMTDAKKDANFILQTLPAGSEQAAASRERMQTINNFDSDACKQAFVHLLDRDTSPPPTLRTALALGWLSLAQAVQPAS